MSPNPAVIERAFRDFLTSRGSSINKLTLGSAFKVILEFQRDVSFDWADPEFDTLNLVWYDLRGQDSSSDGFLGLFKTVTKGDVTGHCVSISRTLEILDEYIGDIDTDISEISLIVTFEYSVSDATVSVFTGELETVDRHNFDHLEDFVRAVLECNLFTAMALETPRSVEVIHGMA